MQSHCEVIGIRTSTYEIWGLGEEGRIQPITATFKVDILEYTYMNDTLTLPSCILE